MLTEYVVAAVVFIAVLFASMTAAFVLGRRFGRRFRERHPEGAEAGIGTVHAAFFALLGLLLAFTFEGAADRFNERRKLIIEETNAVDTAYRRIDLLPAASQPALRADFARYVDSRLAIYRVLPDIEAARKLLAVSASIQDSIWRRAVVAVQEVKVPGAVVVVIGSLNTMIDLTTTRTAATQMHPPGVVYAMLALFSIAGLFFVGFEMAKERQFSLPHVVILSATLAITVYVILDYEFPRVGLIRVDDMDHLLLDLRNKMK